MFSNNAGGIGVNFQPGSASGADGVDGQRRTAGGGVQEAIKILSLRLPRVVGAQAIAPSLLLNSRGSDGNPRVDSVIERIMRRMMPEGAPALPVLGPSLEDGSPSAPSSQPAYPQNYPFQSMQQQYRAPSPDFNPQPRGPQTPRITPGQQPSDDAPRFETPLQPPQTQNPLPSERALDWPGRFGAPSASFPEI